MDDIEKQRRLFVFKSLLYYYNENFVITDPLYDNTQPSKTIEKTIFNHIFHDYTIDLIPHLKDGTIYDFKDTIKFILNSIIGRRWPESKYKFVNELDYINTMKSVNFNVEPCALSQRKLFDDFIHNFIGYGLITKKKDKHVIDIQYLKQFETREGYSKLNCIIYLDDEMRFDYCKIDGQKRTDDFAIRECITGIVTVTTIENHLFKIHFLISDQFNSLLNMLDKTTNIYRVMIPLTNDPYRATESSAIALFGQTGFCNWFNFTRNGIKQYFGYTKRNFKIRDFIIPKELPGNSTIHKHQCLWYKCIHDFVSKFLSVKKIDTYDFIMLLKEKYYGIYDKTKSELENMIDICAMMIYSNVIHECYSNSILIKLSMNPFTLSTTWKHNSSSVLSEKINTLGEQLEVNFISYVTSIGFLLRIDDKYWINACCVCEREKQIYTDFIDEISKLDIPEDAILHPKNISSSISE